MGGKIKTEIDLTLLTWYCHPKVKSSLSKEKDMQAYLGEHLQVATTNRHEAKLTMLRK